MSKINLAYTALIKLLKKLLNFKLNLISHKICTYIVVSNSFRTSYLKDSHYKNRKNMYTDNIIFQFIDSSIYLDTLVSVNRKISICSGKTWF